MYDIAFFLGYFIGGILPVIIVFAIPLFIFKKQRVKIIAVELCLLVIGIYYANFYTPTVQMEEPKLTAEEIKQQNDEIINQFGDAEHAKELDELFGEARVKAEADREKNAEKNKDFVEKIVQIQEEREMKKQNQE